jgi:putative hydrolase of the HAD superfamily
LGTGNPKVQKGKKEKARKITKGLSEKMIKAILFDAGGVYLKGSFVRFMNNGFQVLGVKKIISKANEVIADDLFDRGKISANEFFKRVFNAEISEAQNRLLVKLWMNNWKLEPQMSKLANQLKKNYRLGLLSNSDPVNSPNYAKKGWYKPFEVLVLSHEIGILKPNPKIYKIALEKLRLKPEECLFIDDQEECVKTARMLRMKAILFKSASKLKKDFKKIGIKC